MSFTEKILQTCAPYFEENKNRSFQAQVLDQEKKLLSSGLGLLDKENLHGAFWPKEEKKLNGGIILKHADGREFALQNFRRCTNGISNHYHFQLSSE
jgi:hypothetical protein